MATRLPFSSEQYWNACKRNAFKGACMFTYEAGTTTVLKTTWTTSDESVEHPNPIQADSNGIFPEIYGNGSFFIKIQNNAKDELILQADNIQGQGVLSITAFGSLTGVTDGALQAVGEVGDFIETFEYDENSSIGEGRYEIVSSNPGNNLINPQKTDGSGFYLKLIISSDFNLYKAGALGAGANETANLTQAFSLGIKIDQVGGDFNVISSITVASGTHLIGSGGAKISSTTADVNVLSIASASDVTIDGIELASSLTRQSTGTLGNCVAVLTSSEVIIKNCTMNHGGGSGVYISAGTDVKVLNNSVTTTAFDPAAVSGDFLNNQPAAITVNINSLDVLIDGNRVFDTGVGIECQNPSASDDTDSVTISNNIVSRCATYGINIYTSFPGTGATQRNIKVLGNTVDTVYGSTVSSITINKDFGAGIYVLNGLNVTVSDNTVRNVCIQTDSETLVPACIGFNQNREGSVISDNDCDTSGFYGIMVAGIICPSITGGSIDKTTEDGIKILNCDNAHISSVKLKTESVSTIGVNVTSLTTNDKATISGVDTLGFSKGIEISSTSNITVTGCNLTGCDSFGLNLNGGEEAAVSGNLIETSGLAALSLNNFNNANATGNTLLATAGNFAIRVSGTSAGNFSQYNRMTPFSISSTDGAMVVKHREAAAPTLGNWAQGDTIEYTAPVAAGKIGTVCVLGGAPGTFKEFGVIDA